VASNKPNTVATALRLGLHSMRRHPKLAMIFLAATLAQGGLQGLLVWALREVLIMFSNTKTLTLGVAAWAALSIFFIWTLRAVSTFLGEVYSDRLSRRVEVESMWQMLSKLLTLPVRFFEKNSQGNLVMSAYYDLERIRYVTDAVGQMVLYIARLVGLGFAAWIISPKLAAAGIVAIPLGVLPAYWLGRRITQAAKQERVATTTLYDSFLQVASGIRVIKVNRSESRVIDKSHIVGQELYDHVMRQIQYRAIARLLLEVVSGLGIIVVLIIGGHDVSTGDLDWQSLLGLLVAVIAVYSPVLGIIQQYSEISRSIPTLDRVEQIMRMPATIQDRHAGYRLMEAPRTIELQNLSFAYDNQNAIDSISTAFHCGETIGIVGPSGAGKSTFIALLLRFYEPSEGKILFDGVDLRDIRYADVMDNCAIVLQEPFLFMDTIANNIRIARPDASMEEVIAAAKAANIHDEIMGMEHGYQTALGTGEDGRGISVGQKQRICIAAALLKNAPILFLDEATSNLDSVSESKVQAAVERLMAGRTTFVIAHRLSTLRKADRILVLDRGKMVGLGSHDELLATCEMYQRLCDHQTIEDFIKNSADRRGNSNGKVSSHDVLIKQSEGPQ
jgi:ATP-binding cassette, subfamily B, bacterial MsbA